MCVECRAKTPGDCASQHRKEECKEYYQGLKSTMPCSDCGLSGDATVMMFCARDASVQLTSLSNNGYWSAKARGVDAMKRALEHFVPRCAFCRSVHIDKVRHESTEYSDFKVHWRNRQLAAGCCDDCGRVAKAENAAGFQYAHRDALDKPNELGDMMSVSKAYDEGKLTLQEATRIADEEIIPWCRMLCANCHKHETRVRNSVAEAGPG